MDFSSSLLEHETMRHLLFLAVFSVEWSDELYLVFLWITMRQSDFSISPLVASTRVQDAIQSPSSEIISLRCTNSMDPTRINTNGVRSRIFVT